SAEFTFRPSCKPCSTCSTSPREAQYTSSGRCSSSSSSGIGENDLVVIIVLPKVFLIMKWLILSSQPQESSSYINLWLITFEFFLIVLHFLLTLTKPYQSLTFSLIVYY